MRTNTEADVWARLAAPVPDDAILWRQDGAPVTRDGRFYARFVAYIEANTVRDRLDTVVPGEWELAVRFGIAHELYAYEQNWVPVDGDGPSPRTLEDPRSAYERLHRPGLPALEPGAEDGPVCPKCGGPMWDNRSTKRNPRAPDYKCRDRSCEGVIWPARPTPLPAESIPF
jgi:hypothetical protein